MLFWISLLLAQDPSFVQIAPSMAKIKDVEFLYEAKQTYLNIDESVRDVKNITGKGRFHYLGIFSHEGELASRDGGSERWKGSIRRGGTFRGIDRFPSGGTEQSVSKRPSIADAKRDAHFVINALPWIDLLYNRDTPVRILKTDGNQTEVEIDSTGARRQIVIDHSKGDQIVSYVDVGFVGTTKGKKSEMLVSQFHEVTDSSGQKIWFPKVVTVSRFILYGDDKTTLSATPTSKVEYLFLTQGFTINSGRSADAFEIAFDPKHPVRDLDSAMVRGLPSKEFRPSKFTPVPKDVVMKNLKDAKDKLSRESATAQPGSIYSWLPLGLGTIGCLILGATIYVKLRRSP